MNIISAGSGFGNRGVFKSTRSRGTLSTPLVPNNNDNVFSLLGSIYDGTTTNISTAAINMDVDGSVTAGIAPQRITFWTGTGSSYASGNTRVERMRIDSIGYVGIGVTGPSAKLHVLGGTSSPVFKVDGTSGELFTINDSLTGSLFSVNDISGLPILEVFDDNSVIIGDYQAPSLYTTKKVITSSNGVNNIYSFATASWSSAYVDYNISNGGNYRAGTLVAVFGPAGVEFTEISTLDIGNTTTGAYSLTFSFVLSGTYSILRSTTSITNWNIKTIIRSL
jgi:hypothetical protein